MSFKKNNLNPTNGDFHYNFDMIASVVDGFWEIHLIDGKVSPKEIVKSTPPTNTQFELPPNLTTEEWRSYIHPEDIDKIVAKLDTYLDDYLNFNFYTMEYRIKRLNGSYRWVQSRGKAFRNEEGKPIKLVGTLRDITAEKEVLVLKNNLEEEVKKKTSELQNAVNFQQTILNSTNFGIVSRNKEGVITTFNRGAQQMFGYLADEVVGKETPVIFHVKEELERRARELSKKYNENIPTLEVMSYLPNKKNTVYRDKWTMLRKNGERFPVILTVSALKTQKGEFMGLLGVIEDISQLEKIENDFKVHKERYDLVVNNSSDYVWLMSWKMKGLYIAPSCLRFIGYTEKEIMSMDISQIHTPTSVHKIKKALRDALRSKNKDFRLEDEFEYIHKNGNIIIADVKAYIVYDKNGKSIAIAGVSRDITKRKKAELEKEKLVKKLKRTQALIGLGTWALDALSKKITWNEISYDIYELDKDKEPYFELLASTIVLKERKYILTSFQDFIDEKVLFWKQEYEMITLKGKPIYVEVVGERVKNEEGKVIKYTGTIRDITQRKKVEQEKEKLVKQLKRTQALVGLGTWTLDALSRKVTWSEITYDIYELDKDKEPYFELFANTIISKEREHILTSFQDFVDEKVLFWKQEYEMITLKGKRIHVEVVGERVKNEVREVTKYTGTIRDITQRKKAEQEREIQNKIVKQAYTDIQDSIHYAKTIQEALLSKKELINSYLDDYFIFFKPKEQVSGDFYYVNKIKKHLIFAVADCTGHGVPGGFLTMLGITYLHEIVKQMEVKSVAVSLNLLREKIKDTFHSFGNENENGLDIALCEIDTQNNILQYAGAYHPLWIIREGILLEYKAVRNPIGFHPNEKPFQQIKVQLQKDDMIYLFSDGFCDQFGGEYISKYGRKKFRELLLTIHYLPLTKQKHVLAQTLKKWAGNEEQIDDITIMGIKW